MRRLTNIFFTILMLVLVGCGSDSTPSQQSGTPIIKIVNGLPQPELLSPQIVEIVMNYADGTQGLCSGTIIGKDSILTAAHCFTKKPQLTLVKAGGKFIQATEIINHPGFFQSPVVLALFNDVAIVKTPALLLPRLPIMLTQPIKTDAEMTILGFGLDENGEYGTLKIGVTSAQLVTPNHIFSYPYDGSNVDPCNGDSGGPAVQTFISGTGESFVALVGTVSSGTVIDCEKGDVTLYTNLQNLSVAKFIADHVPDVIFR